MMCLPNRMKFHTAAQPAVFVFVYFFLLLSNLSSTQNTRFYVAADEAGGNNFSPVKDHTDSLDYTAYTQHKPVINFLIMTWGALYSPDIWTAFFKGVPTDRYRVYVHPKNRTVFAETQPTSFPMTIVDEHFNNYCDNSRVMNWLLERALLDSKGPNDVYMFLASDALPVKPFKEMYHRLAVRHVMSLFCIAPTAQWTSLGGNNNLYIQKSHQWMVLNKADAIRSVRAWQKHTNVLELLKSIDPSTTISWKYENGKLKGENCMEELWFIPAIFGLHNTSDPVNMWNYPDKLEQGACSTYVWWPDYEPQSQFRREILYLTDANTRGSQRLWEVPVEFLKSLRSSNFLFARKWSMEKGWNKVTDGSKEMSIVEAFNKYIFDRPW